MILYEIIGWIGTGLIVIAYLLLSTDRIEEDHKSYQFLNLFGAIGVGIHVFQVQAWPALVLQIIWGIVALVSLIKNLKSK